MVERIIGLTGGIGSGKTTVSKIFSSFGIPIFYADTEAKELYKIPEVIKEVGQILKDAEVFDEQGEVVLSKVAAIIFEDEVKRMKLNRYLHPLVRDRFLNWVAKQNASYCIREAAILIESGSYDDCDKIIVVTCPIEIRIDRVMQRDGLPREWVEKRIQAQMSDEERIKYADFVVVNDKMEEDLYMEVLKIHHQLI